MVPSSRVSVMIGPDMAAASSTCGDPQSSAVTNAMQETVTAKGACWPRGDRARGVLMAELRLLRGRGHGGIVSWSGRRRRGGSATGRAGDEGLVSALRL